MTVASATPLFGNGLALQRADSVSAIDLGAFDDAAFDIEAFVIEEDTQDGIAMAGPATLASSGINLTRQSTLS